MQPVEWNAILKNHGLLNHLTLLLSVDLSKNCWMNADSDQMPGSVASDLFAEASQSE